MVVINFAEAAGVYVGLGLKVLPLAPGSKLPLVSKAHGGKGVHDATDDPGTIERWARICPTANIGIATGLPSGIVVIDIDPRNGGSGSIDALAKRGYVFPDCPEAMTQGGGRHLFLALESGIAGSKDRLGPGIDVKSTGGYVVAAPSIGEKGQYSWLRAPLGPRWPRLPRWTVAMLAPPPRPRMTGAVPKIDGGNLSPLERFVASSKPGERNNRLYWAACRAGDSVRKGEINRESAIVALARAAEACGLDEIEAMRSATSGINTGVRRLGNG